MCRKVGCACDDYLVTIDFVEGVRRNEPVALDIDDAMDLTLPRLVSQAPIAQDSAWLELPDSREW